MRECVMLTKKLTLSFIFLVSTSFLSASEMESVLEVGRENSSQSAVSQEKIDSTEKQTDKIVNEYKVVAKQVEGLKLYNEQKRIQIQAQLDFCLLYTSPSPRDNRVSRMPSSA